MTFFGEERGLLGSRYYARHPVWPIEKTIAQLNLEQVGRTDSTEGPQISNATLTGFDYSNLTDYVADAGKLTGIKIYNNSRNSDQYFSASDNLSLAQAGVPAETLCVAFDYSDYHAVGDEWPKINYENMAKVDRAVALSLLIVAGSDEPPHWNTGNPKVAPFLKAWKRAALAPGRLDTEFARLNASYALSGNRDAHPAIHARTSGIPDHHSLACESQERPRIWCRSHRPV